MYIDSMYTPSRIDIMINLGQNTVTSIGIFILIVILRLMTASLTMKNRKFSFVLPWARETDRPTSRNMILPLLAIVIKITWSVTKYILMLVMGLCLILLFVFAVMMLTRIPGRVVSDGEVGRLGTNRRKDEIYVKVNDSYKHFDGGNQENIGYQLRKRKSYTQKENTKKQKESSTQVKIQNVSFGIHPKIYENGPCKFIEHHHGETQKFIELDADISFLTNHFFCESFISLVTMIIHTETDEEHIQLGSTQAIVEEADQPAERGNQYHQNYERDDNTIDLGHHRRHGTSTWNNRSSLVDSHTSSGFNSLTVYDHASYLAIGQNDLSITSATSGQYRQQNIHRSTNSSGYQSGRRRSSVASRPFSFSPRLQADRPITEEEQNNGYTDDIIDNIIEPHTSCSMNDQQFPISSQDLAGQQAQQNSTVRGCRLRESENFPRSSPIPQSAVLRPVRHELNTRENRLSSIENTSTVSIRESTCTLRKEVQSSENPPDDNFHQQATPTTTASSRPRPQDQPRMLERPTCSAICNNDSSCNGSKEKCPVRFCSRTLPHDMYNMGYINRATPKGQGKQAAQYDTTESTGICTKKKSNDCCHRNSNHYGSFDRIHRNGNIMCQDQAQGSLLTTTCTEEKNERQASVRIISGVGLASSSLTNDDDLFGEGQSPIPNLDLLELTEENGEEGEDEVNETIEFPCSTGDTGEEDLPQDD